MDWLERIEKLCPRTNDTETPYGRYLRFETIREGGVHWMSLLIGEKVCIQWGTLATDEVDLRAMSQILDKEAVDGYLLSIGV
jgi:hypothetical protein